MTGSRIVPLAQRVDPASLAAVADWFDETANSRGNPDQPWIERAICRIVYGAVAKLLRDPQVITRWGVRR